MKSLKNTIRMLIAEWLLGVAFSVSANNDEGSRLRLAIRLYFIQVVAFNQKDKPVN